jgi:hypothetical protein
MRNYKCKHKHKGGLLLPYKDQRKSQTIFFKFLDNAESVKIISKGTYGLTFQVRIPYPVPEHFKPKDYREIRPDALNGQPVNTILIKLCYIHSSIIEQDEEYESYNKEDDEYYKETYGDYDESYDEGYDKGYEETIYIDFYNGISVNLNTVGADDFQNEVNVQTDVYLKTIEYMQPLCPGIVYANILNRFTGKEILGKLISKSDSHLQRLFTSLGDNLEDHIGLSLGVIGMQFVNNSSTLSSAEKNEEDMQSKLFLTNMGRYVLLKLALDTGYNHNDFHKNNILIEIGNNIYFDGLENRPFVIDFGRATKLPLHIMSIIKKDTEHGDYMQALRRLCSHETGNEYVVDPRNESYYGWVCGDEDSALDNRIIADLFQRREQAIDLNIKEMNEIRDEIKLNHGSVGLDRFPLLPLSNAIKNKLYEGMGISGGKKTRRHRISKKRRISKRRHIRRVKKFEI